MLVGTNKLAAESVYHNPDSLLWLLGHANEAMVVVEGVEMMALVDAGPQISALTEGFCTEMGLKILPLRNLIGVCCILRGWGGILKSHKRYIEATQTILDLPQFNEDILFFKHFGS